MRLNEFAGVPVEHTARAVGLRKVRKNGRVYWMPVSRDPQKINQPINRSQP